MDDQTEAIKEYIKSLPKDMRDYLAKDEWPQKLSLITQANKLTEVQTSALKAEVLLILIGIENYSELRASIQKNIAGISNVSIEIIANDIEKNIFSEIKPLLEEMEKANNEAEVSSEEDLSKDAVLHEIENPSPVKPIAQSVQNPAGKNPILDAQHNLPEQEKKILISSAAVPSRGPMLGNLKPNFGSFGAIPAAPITPAVPPKPISQPPQPVQTIQAEKPPQATIPTAPIKYKVDPYRESAE